MSEQVATAADESNETQTATVNPAPKKKTAKKAASSKQGAKSPKKKTTSAKASAKKPKQPAKSKGTAGTSGRESSKKKTSVTTKDRASAKKSAKRNGKQSPSAPSAPNGLSPNQTKILKALVTAGGTAPLSKIRRISKIQKGFYKLIGAATKDGHGSAGEKGLIARKLVKPRLPEEGSRELLYIITAKGRKHVQ